MDFFKNILLSKQHPITELLMLWARRNKLPNPPKEEVDFNNFIKIPNLERMQIISVDMSLKKEHSISDSFSPYKELFNWDEEIESILYNLLISQTKQSTFYILSSLLNIISFLIHPEIPQTNENLTIIFQTLISIHSNDFESHVEYIFRQVAIRFLNNMDLSWSGTNISYAIKFLRLHPRVFNEEPSMFFVITEKINSSILHDDLLLIVNELLDVCKTKAFSFDRIENYPKIIRLLDQFLTTLNTQAIEIYSHISHHNDSSIAYDRFVSLGVLVCDRVAQLTTKFTFQEKEETNEEQENDELKPLFFEGTGNSFEKGFHHYQTTSSLQCEPLESLLDESVRSLIEEIISTIEEADIKCINCFLDSFSRALDAYSQTKTYYNCYMCFLVSAARLCRLTPIACYRKQICDFHVFDPKETVFTTLEPFIDVIRTHIFEVFSTVSPEELANRVVEAGNNASLKVECIARIMSCATQPDYSIFCTERLLKAVAKCLRQLQVLRRKGENVVPELNTVFAFIVKLLATTQSASICFTHSNFANALLNMIYDSDLSPKIIVFFCDYLSSAGSKAPNVNISKVLQTFLENNKIELANTFADELQKSLSRNPTLCLFYETFVDDLLDIAYKMKDKQMETSALKMILISVRQTPGYLFSSPRLIKLYKAIEATEGDAPSETTFGQLMNITAQTNVLQTNSIFLIRVPSIIVTFLVCFAKSKKVVDLLDILKKLCSFSSANCIACHDGGLDTALLDFLLNGKIEHRGLEITPNIPSELIDAHIYPLICLIAQEKSSNAVARRFVKLMLGQKDVALKAADVLNKHISASTNRMKPTFRIGTAKPFLTCSGISGQRFNQSFSFSFYLNADLPVSTISNGPKNIVTFTDENGAYFSILLSRGSIFIKYLHGVIETSLQCTNRIESNKWTLLTLTFQKISPTESAIGFYNEHIITLCQKSEIIEFSGDVRADFGGNTAGDMQCALLGPFGMTFTMLSDANISSIFARGKNAFAEKLFFFSSNNLMQDSSSSKARSEISFQITEMLDSKGALSRALATGGHLLRVLSGFDKIDLKLAELIIGIVKLVMGASSSSQENFGSFCFAAGSLMKVSQECLTYQLYLAFYSMGDVITIPRLSEDLFDNIIMNFELWSNATPQVFLRVTHHWAHVVAGQYKETLSRQGFFGRALKNCNEIFGNIPDTNDVLCRARQNFFVVLGQCENLTKQDCEYLLLLSILETNSEQMTLSYLKLVTTQAKYIVSTAPALPHPTECFLQILSRSERVCIAALVAMGRISPSDMTLACSAKIVRNLPFASSVVNTLCSLLPEYPGLAEFISIVCLSLDAEIRDYFSAAMKALSDSDADIQAAKGKGWPVFPTVLLCGDNEIAADSLLQSISKIILTSEKPEVELYNVICAILFIQSVSNKCLGSFACQLVLLCKEHATQKSILTASLLRIGTSSALDALFLESPFNDSPAENPQKGISSLDALKTTYIRTVMISPSPSKRKDISQLLPLLTGENALTNLVREIGNPTTTKPSHKGIDLAHPDVANLTQNASSCFAEITGNLNAFIDEINSSQITEINTKKLLTMLEKRIPVRIKVPCSVHEDISRLEIASAAALTQAFEKKRSARYSLGSCPSLKMLVPVSFPLTPQPKTLFALPKIVGLYSIPCQQWELGTLFTVCFTVGNGMIQILKSQVSCRTIEAQDMVLILPRGISSIEIFTNNGSIFLDFSPAPNTAPLNALYEQCPFLDRPIDAMFASMIQKRSVWSNFDFIITAEMFSGKTFHIKEKLPVLLDGHSYEEYTQLDDLKKAASLRYEFESQDIYELSEKLCPIMTCFAQLIKPLNDPEPTTDLYEASPIHALFDNKRIYLIEKEKIQIIDLEKSSISSIPTKCENTDVSQYLVNDSLVYLLHGSTKTLEVVSRTNSVVKQATDISCISKSGERLIFCKGECDVFYCTSSQFPDDPYRTNLFTEKISAIGSSSFGLAVIGTEKCRIHAMSMDGLEAYGAIELPLEPREIVVTDIFNIIGIDLWDKVVCYTMDGKKIFEVEAKTTSMSAFSEMGRDFILAFNESRVIVIDPIFERIIEVARDENIIGAGFIGTRRSICVVTKGGFIHMIPFYVQL